MFKKFSMIAAVLLLLATNGRAQDTLNKCGVNAAYFLSKAKTPTSSSATFSLVPPISFPAGAVVNCGRFALYFEDVRIDLAGGGKEGFAHTTKGATRRATLCDVLSYIETVFDFSRMPPGAKIRLYIDQSYSSGLKPVTLLVDAFKSNYGVAAAYYDGSVTSGVVAGFVERYIKTGGDPNPNDYHGTMQMNFHQAVGWPPVLASGKKFTDWYSWDNANDGTGTTALCQPDLYQRLLHLMGHVLGFAGFHYGLSSHPLGGGGSTSLYTTFENSLYKASGPITATPAYLSSLVPAVAASTIVGNLWLNNKSYPDNYPLTFMHFNDVEYYLQRMSPGDYQPHVMGDINNWGTMKRKFTKGDLDAFLSNVGLPAHPASFSSSGPAAGLYTNHLPYSDRMASMAYSAALPFKSAAERLPADYTITNNTGTSLTINLSSLTADLHDADGDPITIMDGSLVNIRGCGQGGNNHALLTVNPAKNVLTYTPRVNYYGRSQFGFNLWDGKEKGAFVTFTIDVLKGTAVSIPFGDNIVLNGDFEEGSEVRTLANNANSYTNNALYIGKLGRLSEGLHHADAHPYDCYSNNEGNAIRGSYADCATVDAGFGSPFNSFPLAGGTAGLIPAESPDAYFPAGISKNDRYMILNSGGSLLNLGGDLQQCKVYKMEFDVRHQMSPAEHTYPAATSFKIAFTDNTHLVDPYTIDPAAPNLGLLTYNYTLPPYSITGVSNSAWKHVTLYFTYCAHTPSNILYIGKGSQEVSGAELIDNISIKEMLTIPMSVSVAQEQVERCTIKLTAGDIVNGCAAVAYQWRVKGDPAVLATTREYTFPNPNMPTTYEVSVSDGCNTVKGEAIADACACTPGKVFGGAPFTPISGSAITAAALPSGFYYLDHNVTVSANSTFTGVKMLIEPGVKITVANNVKLILDSCHLFVCPDTNKLWQGIVLASTGAGAGGSSARIEVGNNSLIEDALYAIDANDLKAPPSGDVIRVSNSTFNRNQTGISVNRAYAMGAAGTYPVSITNSLFTARNFNSTNMPGYPNKWASAIWLKEEFTSGLTNTKAPYRISRDFDKAYLKSNVPAYLGVEFQNIGTTFGGGTAYAEVVMGAGADVNKNLVDNTQYGIHSKNSNVALYNTHVINVSKRMVPDDPRPYASSGGMGIIAQNEHVAHNRFRLGYTQGSYVKLYDCFVGICINNVADADLSNAIISSSHKQGGVTPGAEKALDGKTGIGIQMFGDMGNHTQWTVSNNIISNVHTGISTLVYNPKLNATTGISNNNFHRRNPDTRFAGLTTLQYMNDAVFAYSYGLTAANTLTASGNRMDSVYNGIHFLDLVATRATASGNSITLYDVTMSTPNTQYGINMEGCINVRALSNTINTNAPGTAGRAARIKGLHASYNNVVDICDNGISRIGHAFEFAPGPGQPYTSWANNRMTDAWKGMVLGSPIGHQMVKYIVIGGGPMYSLMRIDLYAGGNQWLGSWAGRQQTYATVDSRSSILLTRPGIAAENPTLNFGVPLSFAYTTVGSPGPWFYVIGSSGPYASLQSPSQALLNCPAGMNPGGGPLTNPGTGTSSGQLATYLLAGSNSAYLSNSLPGQWMAQLGLWKAGLADPSLTSDFIAYQQFMNAAGDSRFKWLTDIETALAAGNTTLAGSLLAAPVQAMGIVPADTYCTVMDVPDANPIVAQHIAYYTLQRNYMLGSGLDTPALLAIANLCPALYGSVVYQARSLHYSLSGLRLNYADEDCAGTNTYRTTQNGAGSLITAQAYSLYPNPNDGNLVLRQSVTDGGPVQMLAYDLQGKVVLQKALNFSNGKAAVQMGEVAAGTYLIRLSDSKGLQYSVKFTIK